MVIHKVDAALADRAVMRACWLDHLTAVAHLWPKLFKLFHCFAPVPEKLFDIAREALEAIVIFKGNFLSCGPIFLLLPQLFYISRVLRATWLDEHCKHVVEDSVVCKGESNYDPYDAEESSYTVLK